MVDAYQTVRCAGCGQLNRLRLETTKAGVFKCSKCERLLHTVAYKDGGKTVTGAFALVALVAAILFVVFVGSTVDQQSKNIGPQRTPSDPTATTAKRMSPSEIRENKRIESLIPTPPAYQEAPLRALPVLPVEVHGPTLAKTRPPAEAPNANEPKRRPPGLLDMEAPAPGCLEKLPTYESVRPVCQVLDEPACSKQSVCEWDRPSSSSSRQRLGCVPKVGSYVSSHELDPPGPLGVLDIKEPSYSSAATALANADRHAANGRLDRAIVEYSSLLKTEPDFPQVLGQRAAAYERKGNKERALADYCRILVISSNRDRRLAARERIAALSGKAPNRLSSPEQPLSSSSEKHLNIVPTPRTGEIQPRHGRKAIAPFSVETEAGTNYFIKLVNDANVRDQIWIFIKGGEMYSTKVPLGQYNLRAATGGEWYGREDLFGPTTRFFRLRSKRGSGATEVETLRFFKEGNRNMGMTLKFKPVQDGNMEQEAMSRSEFDAN